MEHNNTSVPDAASRSASKRWHCENAGILLRDSAWPVFGSRWRRSAAGYGTPPPEKLQPPQRLSLLGLLGSACCQIRSSKQVLDALRTCRSLSHFGPCLCSWSHASCQTNVSKLPLARKLQSLMRISIRHTSGQMERQDIGKHLVHHASHAPSRLVPLAFKQESQGKQRAELSSWFNA